MTINSVKENKWSEREDYENSQKPFNLILALIKVGLCEMVVAGGLRGHAVWGKPWCGRRGRERALQGSWADGRTDGRTDVQTDVSTERGAVLRMRHAANSGLGPSVSVPASPRHQISGASSRTSLIKQQSFTFTLCGPEQPGGKTC